MKTSSSAEVTCTVNSTYPYNHEEKLHYFTKSVTEHKKSNRKSLLWNYTRSNNR